MAPPRGGPETQGLEPSALTLDEAVGIVDAKAARMAKRGQDPYAPRPAKGAAKGKGAKKGKGAAARAGGGGAKALNGYQVCGGEGEARASVRRVSAS